MKAKSLMLVAMALLLLATGWHFSRVPYHRWRLAANIRTAERLRAGNYSLSDDFVYLLRGEPKTTRDYERAIIYHEDTLIELEYFTRTNFILAAPLRSDRALSNFFSRAAKKFPDTQDWSASITTEGDIVTVTTRPHRIKEWEGFIREIEGSSGKKVRQRKTSCRRQTSWFRASAR